MAANMLCGCGKRQLRLKPAVDGHHGDDGDDDDDYYKRRSLALSREHKAVISSTTTAPVNAGAETTAADCLLPSVKPRRRFPSPLLKPQRRVFVMAESNDSFDVWVKNVVKDASGNGQVIEEYRVTARLESLLQNEQVQRLIRCL